MKALVFVLLCVMAMVCSCNQEPTIKEVSSVSLSAEQQERYNGLVDFAWRNVVYSTNQVAMCACGERSVYLYKQNCLQYPASPIKEIGNFLSTAFTTSLQDIDKSIEFNKKYNEYARRELGY